MSSEPALHDPLRVVIAGGGVAALEALVALRTAAPGRVAPALVTDAREFVYRPLLVGEPFGLGRPHRYALDELCADLGAEIVADRVVEVLGDQRLVLTRGDALVPYDVLLVATGAWPHPAFEAGVTFERELSPEDFDEALADLSSGLAPHIAIVVPDGVSWTLPAYELALLTAAWGARHHADAHRVTLVTHEPAPLAAFGSAVAGAVGEVLEDAHVALRCGTHADVVSATALRAAGSWIGADRIVSLPLLAGPRLRGLPCDAHGFILADADGRVEGVDGAYVAGDAGTFPIKQGGLAAQQAEAAVADVLRIAGVPPLRERAPGRVLRGVLPTRRGPRFLRAELDDVEGTSTFSAQPLWWPPSKISSRWLAPYLARRDAEHPAPSTSPASNA